MRTSQTDAVWRSLIPARRDGSGNRFVDESDDGDLASSCFLRGPPSDAPMRGMGRNSFPAPLSPNFHLRPNPWALLEADKFGNTKPLRALCLYEM
jgi:hypothetical protein